MNRTIYCATKSECRQKHAALVEKSGRVISWAINKYYNDPAMFPSDLLTREREMISVHAEINAIRRVSPEVLLGATIYVARVGSKGAALSRPCERCEDALVKAGVRKVIYTYS